MIIENTWISEIGRNKTSTLSMLIGTVYIYDQNQAKISQHNLVVQS
jgi:hypothetical protein